MKRKLGYGLVFAATLLAVQAASAAVTMSLVELGFKSSADGIVYDDPYGTWPPPTADLSGFNFGTGLGSIKFTFSGAGTHYVAGLFDYQFTDVGAGNGLDNEWGEVNGAPGAGQSWQIDDPWNASIYGDFSAFDDSTPLMNTNGLPSGTPGDVALALGYYFTIGVGDPDVDVIFTASTSAPTSTSSWLRQVDPSGDSVYLYFGSGGSVTVPEPGSIALVGLALGAAAWAGRQRRRFQEGANSQVGYARAGPAVTL